MNTESLLQTYFLERNSSPSTQRNYRLVVKAFEEHTQKTLPGILEIAEKEEQKIKWQKSTLYYFLISFRKHLYETHQPRTAQMKFTVIKSILRYFDINILPLKSFSTKRYPKIELTPEDIITQEELKICVNVKGPLLKAIALFMSSSGVTLIDTLNLQIKDYLKALNLKNTENITQTLKELNKQEPIIPVFEKMVRQKTGVQYTTFCSPEAVTAINNYLIYREKKEKESVKRCHKKSDLKTYTELQLSDQLFKGNHGSIERMFRETNDAVGLGKAGNYAKFSPHMLRRYHTTQLYAAGFSEHKINLLQGRKSKEVIHQSYLRVRTETLKDEYIKALPYLVVEDTSKVKTELEIVKEENKELKQLNKDIRKIILEELTNMRERETEWEKL